jgi:hypothetical protein
MVNEQRVNRSTFVMVVMLAIGVAAFAAPPAESIDIDIVGREGGCGAEPRAPTVSPKTELCFHNLLDDRVFVDFPPGVIQDGVTQISVDPGEIECKTLSEDSTADEFEYIIFREDDYIKVECTDTGDRPRIIIDRGHRSPEDTWTPITREYE